MSTETTTDWATVTDCPCHIPGCPGLLRWAEAGRVPGSRICDCCGTDYELAGGELIITRRRRVTPRKIADMHDLRRQSQAATARFHSAWADRQAQEYREDWERETHGVHGPGSIRIPSGAPADAHYCDPEALTAPHRAVVSLCHGLEAALRALTGDRRVSVISATRDGSAVLVYDLQLSGRTRLDGWWHTAGLRQYIAECSSTPGGSPVPDDALLSADQRRCLGVHR